MKLHLGENIRENRRRLGLTQEQLADRLGVSFQSVSRWENGTTYPDMELIPQIARLFGTTIDALVGFVPDYGNEKEKAAYEDVTESLGNAMMRNAWNECIGLLQLIRSDYFDELDKTPHLFFNAVLPYGRTFPLELLEEFRKTSEAVLSKAKNRWLRSNMIRYMAEIEDDEHFMKLAEQYSVWDDSTTMEALFMHRYKMHGELEKYEKLRIVKKFRQLRSFFFDYADRIRLGPVDAAGARDRYAALLGMLHSLCLTEPDEKHPVSGNGKVDFLAEMRMMTGIHYAVCLSGCGDTDGALTVIEDIADMLEQLDAMELNDELTCTAPEFRGLTLYKHKGVDSMDPTGKRRIRLDFYSEADGMSFAIIAACCVELSRCVDMLSEFSQANVWGSRWLDAVRDEPRFREAYRRIEACCLCDNTKE